MTKCLECGAPLERKEKERYQFLECGLKNVFLEGVAVYHCRSCDSQYPEILNIEGLHARIAEALVQRPFALSGPEFRFLRKHMRMKAKDLAHVLGVTATTISRWETGSERIGPANDRLIRLFYVFSRLKQGQAVDLKRILQRVQIQLEAIRPGRKTLPIELPVEMVEPALAGS